MSNKVLKFSKDLAPLLEKKLTELGFQKEENSNVIFSYKGEGLKVVFYPTGTLLIQGKGNKEALAEKLVEDLTVETDYIGTDEAGKGDLFGPLVVCGFVLTQKNLKEVLKLGVRDSKSVPLETLEQIAETLVSLKSHRCITIMPETYNKIYRDFQNLNKLLSFAHANVIDGLYLKAGLKKAVVDKFMAASYIDCYVNAPVEIKEETKAERYPAVAAASILARYIYLKQLKELSKIVGLTLPAGSGNEAKAVFQELRSKFDTKVLKKIAKLHFRVS
jgi:ribonuclease HIII